MLELQFGEGYRCSWELLQRRARILQAKIEGILGIDTDMEGNGIEANCAAKARVVIVMRFKAKKSATIVRAICDVARKLANKNAAYKPSIKTKVVSMEDAKSMRRAKASRHINKYFQSLDNPLNCDAGLLRVPN